MNRLSVIAALLTASTVAYGHHSFAMYNMEKEITVKGEVKVFAFQNPHSGIQFSVTDEKGQASDWLAETGNPTGLAKLGWKRSILKPGDKVTFVLHPMKDGSKGGSLARVTLADGTVLQTSQAGVE
jgi:Family of unknown function (DUF6152)